MSRDGLTSAQLRRGGTYRCTAPLALALGATIKIESIGPRYVRYREWGSSYTTWRGWSTAHRHPRALFDSWDGWWAEVDDPSAAEVA